jgi:UDP-glucose 4-epimerase
MRVLVTGGAGFIGSHVVEEYLRSGHEVAVLDDFSTGTLVNVPPGVRVYEGDIRNAATVAEVLDSFAPEIVSHHAAHVSVDESVRQPEVDCLANVLGSILVFQAAARTGVRRVIFASSGGAVYGNASTVPTAESAPLRPESPYAIAKMTAEEYLRFFEPSYAEGAVILRYSNVYGPRQRVASESGVVAIFCDHALRQLPLSICGDGLQTRDFVYVRDVARANARALIGPAGTYNVGTGRGVSIRDLVQRLESVMAFELPVTSAPERAAEVRHSVLDTTHAKEQLGFSAEYSLEEGLRLTLESSRLHLSDA